MPERRPSTSPAVRSRRVPGWPLLAAALLAGCAPRVPMPPGPLAVVRVASPPPARVVVPPPAPGGEAEVSPQPPARPPDVGRRLAEAARSLLDGPPPSGWRDDCSGFVCAASSRVGLDLPPSTRALWELAEEAGAVHRSPRPRRGDLAFFDDTWDRNGNGRVDDPLTHVGVVIEVEDDGTVLVAHRSTSAGRTVLRMNLLHPHARQDDTGKVLNDYLRRRGRRDPPQVRYLAGELWRGFASAHRLDRS